MKEAATDSLLTRSACMAVSDTIDFPGCPLAYREYEVELEDHSTASIAITLGDFQTDTLAGRFAHEHDAIAYGLISVLNTPDAPARPIVWMVDTEHLSLAIEEDAKPVTRKLMEVLELYLDLFLAQVTPLAPHLEGVRIVGLVPANDNGTAQ